MRFAIRLAAFAALIPAGAAGAATLIHAGRLIDGVSGAPRERVTVVVDGDRIRSIDAGFAEAGAGDQVVDLSAATVLPGLMDMHVHLTSEHSRRSEIDAIKKSESDRAYDSVVYAERTLLAGFTTVRNLGDTFNISIALRRAIADGKVKGPRIFTSGRSIGTRGGHADATNSFGPFLGSDDPRLDTVCNGPDSCREAVRTRYQDGADCDQDHGDRRRALDREVGHRPAVYGRGARGGHHDSARLRHEGRGPRARQRRNAARRARRHRFDRTRHLHG